MQHFAVRWLVWLVFASSTACVLSLLHHSLCAERLSCEWQAYFRDKIGRMYNSCGWACARGVPTLGDDERMGFAHINQS